MDECETALSCSLFNATWIPFTCILFGTNITPHVIVKLHVFISYFQEKANHLYTI